MKANVLAKRRHCLFYNTFDILMLGKSRERATPNRQSTDTERILAVVIRRCSSISLNEMLHKCVIIPALSQAILKINTCIPTHDIQHSAFKSL